MLNNRQSTLLVFLFSNNLVGHYQVYHIMVSFVIGSLHMKYLKLNRDGPCDIKEVNDFARKSDFYLPTTFFYVLSTPLASMLLALGAA